MYPQPKILVYPYPVNYQPVTPLKLQTFKKQSASPKNVYSMKSTRYVPSVRQGTEMSILTDDSITEICRRMSVSELESFVSTSYKNLTLCNDILNEKIKYDLKLRIKNKIVDALENLEPGYILDISNILDENIDDMYLRKLHQPDWNLVEIPNYPGLYVRRSKLDVILDILNTE